MFLVVGLGNPGEEYEDNRHNIGFMVADRLLNRFRVEGWKKKFGGECGKGEAFGHPVIVLKPLEYMNVSGKVVQRTAAFYQIDPRDTIVIHDDLDLDFNRVKVKVGGGHGGHNGLRSIVEQLGPAFVRVRCGVGHPGEKGKVVGHVLGPFNKAEQKELPDFTERAADAVDTVIRDGASAAMNKVNGQ